MPTFLIIFALETPKIARMNRKYLVLALTATLALGAKAQVSNVNPTPQSVTSSNVLFPAPKAWSVSHPKALSGTYIRNAVNELPVEIDSKAKFRLTLGLVGDANLKKYKPLVPAQAEGYYMAIGPKGIVIAGRDERGLYYGVQTLRDMIEKGQLETCTLQDWPDVRYRGAIEGFYGQPWSHEHRLRQLDYYGRNKMNVYIYGPKDDPYHRDKWRVDYPEQEARQIQELNERAKLRGVNFYWAIHPGVDIKWNDEDRDNLVRKLEKMYALGIRSFAVFFDDIWGEGAKGENQAALLNHVDEVFVKKHGDIAPLLLCPTEYNRSWSSDDSKYLAALGNGLREGIEVMWTGNTVVHTIDREGMDWINSRIKRKGYIWFNFPVNDFVRDRMLLGPTYGNGLDVADQVSGFVSNPMQYAESSKIALYSIADYTWNMKAYDWASSWQRAIRDVLPSDSVALRVFASYNEDLGPNGHGFRRDESRHLKGLQERIEGVIDGRLTYDGKHAESFEGLAAECRQLAAACDLLLVNGENPWLIHELRPWLVQGKVVADYGQLAVDLYLRPEGEELRSFEARVRQARALRKLMYENEVDKNQLHYYQTGTKLATLRLLPTIDKVINAAIKDYNARHNTQLEAIEAYAPFTIESTVPQLRQQPITVQGNEVKIAASNEVINWPKDAEFVLKADRPVTLQGMDFNFGEKGIASKFALELQLPDGTWTPISLLHGNPDRPMINTGNELGGKTITALRVKNVSGGEVQCYFRHFRVAMR